MNGESKRFQAIGITVAILILLVLPAFAGSSVRLFINGNPVDSAVAPQIINGCTLAPARAIAEALGGKADWDPVSGNVGLSIPTIEKLIAARPFDIGSGEPTLGSLFKNQEPLGAVVALNLHLAQRQAEMLAESEKTVILRYEIIEAGLAGPMPSYDAEDGYQIGARIYWAGYREDGITPGCFEWQTTYRRDEQQQKDYPLGSSSQGPQIEALWYEDVIYTVKPTLIDTVQQDLVTTETVGGWAVDQAAARLIRTVPVAVADWPNVFAVPWPQADMFE